MALASVYNRGTKNKPNWWIKYKDSSGAWRRKPTKQLTKEAAKRYGAEVVARVARNIIGIPDSDQLERPSTTVSQLFERFLLEYHGPKVRNLDEYREQRRSDYQIRVRTYSIGKLDAQKVRLSDVERWRDELRESGYAPKTINESIKYLKLVFTWACRREILDVVNPCTNLVQLPTEPLQERYSLEEVHRILASPQLPIGVAIALYTGLRRGEIAGMSWSDVDFKVNRIHVKRSYAGPTKTGKPRIVPIHRELRDLLERWRPSCPSTDLDLVCPIEIDRVYRAATQQDEQMVAELRQFLQQAGCCSDFIRPWHAFRHTFATQFLEQGGAQAALERILGHTTSGSQVTALYVHVDFSFLARELDRITLLPPRQ